MAQLGGLPLGFRLRPLVAAASLPSVPPAAAGAVRARMAAAPSLPRGLGRTLPRVCFSVSASAEMNSSFVLRAASRKSGTSGTSGTNGTNGRNASGPASVASVMRPGNHHRTSPTSPSRAYPRSGPGARPARSPTSAPPASGSAHPDSSSSSGPASQRQDAGESRISTEGVLGSKLTDDPVVIYRGGPAFPIGFSTLIGLGFLIGGAYFSYLIGGFLPWPLPLFGFDANDPEKSKPASIYLRLSLAGVVAVLGMFGAMYFIGLQTRTITRMTLHLKSGLVGIRTCKPSIWYLLPRRWVNTEKHGLYHPFATADGRPGSKMDRRTRVVPLHKVFTHLQRSTIQYYVRNDLLPREQNILAGVLPSRQTRPVNARNKTKSKFTTRESADKEDLTFLLVRPYRVLWGLRASGGRPEANTGPWLMQLWRNFIVPKVDWDDVPPQQAEELRKAGDAYVHQLVAAHARRSKVPLAQVEQMVMPHGLGERQVWFRNRKTFDELFPVVP